MRFMTIYKPADTKRMEAGTPPTQDEIARMGEFIQDLMKSGVLIQADGLLPSSMGARVRQAAGKLTVTDGPFSEAKELIGGFAILNVASKEQAIEVAKRFLKVAGDGESEIRQMHDAPAFKS